MRNLNDRVRRLEATGGTREVDRSALDSLEAKLEQFFESCEGMPLEPPPDGEAAGLRELRAELEAIAYGTKR